MLMDLIKARHSIRKYTEEQISKKDLEKILEAGNYAQNAGGGQRSMMVAIHNKKLASYVGKMNLMHFDRTHLAGNFVSKEQPSTIDDPTIKNGYYDAPTVVCVFCQDLSLIHICIYESSRLYIKMSYIKYAMFDVL